MLSYFLTKYILYPLFHQKDRTLSALLTESDVPILVFANIDYSQAALPYNLRLSYTPEVIALPQTVAQVQAAIRCAQETSTKVAARCGGHSYAAFGLGGKDGSLVIDMAKFSGVSVDAETGVATVGGGVRLGNMASELWRKGERAYPHGTCPGVGIAGHSLLGGFGHPSRMWGLAVDLIISLSVVLADGSFVTVSEHENPDLYWAFRGAGPSFGIVTEFKLKTYPAPKTNIVYAYTYRSMDPVVLTEAFLAVQEFGIRGPPQELGIGMEVRQGVEFRIRGVYFGTLEEFHTVIGPLVAELNTIYSDSEYAADIQVDDMTWMESLEFLCEGKPMLTVPGEYDEHDTFFAKSLVEPAAEPLTEESVSSLFKYLVSEGQASSNPWFIIINLYGGPNSAITRPPPSTSPLSTSSYGHRDCLFVFQLYAHTSSRQPEVYMGSLVPLVDGMVTALVNGEGEKFGGYPGYIDPTLEAKMAHEMYYGAAYPRLKEIKKRFDPMMLFWNPLAIGES